MDSFGKISLSLKTPEDLWSQMFIFELKGPVWILRPRTESYETHVLTAFSVLSNGEMHEMVVTCALVEPGNHTSRKKLEKITGFLTVQGQRILKSWVNVVYGPVVSWSWAYCNSGGGDVDVSEICDKGSR